jgi:hypothetical protein
MASATVAGSKYNVRVVQDLADNWSLEVYPVPDGRRIKTAEPFKNWPVPLCIKIRADSREDALTYGLEYMKKLGKIDDFELLPDERPKPPPPKAGPAAAKAAEVKAPDETEP